MKALVVLVLLAGIAAADTSASLREGNTAAAAGDWAKVEQVVGPLLTQQPPPAKVELAEAYRLLGVAAFFDQRTAAADGFLFAWLKLDLDGQLDPGIYPPEAIAFLANVRETHKQELRALRPKPKGSIYLSLLPPLGQFQNGERVKGIVVGSLLGAFVVANVASAITLASWCDRVSGTSGSSYDCSGHAPSTANALRTTNLATGILAIATYVYGVYDGVTHYRRRMREAQWMPYAAPTSVGVLMRF